MRAEDRAIADLTFLTREEGGRANPPEPVGYMPHVVVEGTSTYLGVRFTGGPSLPAGELGRFEFEAMYPEVDYSSLEPGAAITVREGGKIVARGTVIERVPGPTA